MHCWIELRPQNISVVENLGGDMHHAPAKILCCLLVTEGQVHKGHMVISRRNKDIIELNIHVQCLCRKQCNVFYQHNAKITKLQY
jgi:hypothetical protein